jgi:phosphatidylserine/phosphatidylglycerophosphate/cardiolipin synthase-like enzyme
MLWDQTGSSKNTAEVAAINGLTNGAAILDNHQSAPLIGSQHQKMLVVRGEQGLVAFCGGIDINCDRICPAGSCPPTTSGGVAIASSGSSTSNPGQPLHDIHCQIKGPAAHDLLHIFIKRWFTASEHVRLDRAKGALRGLGEPVPPPAGPALVRVGETYNATTTMPSGVTTTFRDRSVQEILLASISAARRYIYIEEQYMIGLCAAEALRRALPNVDHITILIAASEISDLPRRWELRKRFIDHIRADPAGHKLRVFAPCLPGAHGPAAHPPHSYVHAKTTIIDDEVAIIGSANVNRRGWEHDAEVVAAIVGAARDGTSLAAKLRVRLWAEHLRVSPSAVADPITSKGLWTTAPSRRVCPYDPLADTDGFFESRIPVDLIDPAFPLATAPCCAFHGPSCPGGRLVPAPSRREPLLAGLPGG